MNGHFAMVSTWAIMAGMLVGAHFRAGHGGNGWGGDTAREGATRRRPMVAASIGRRDERLGLVRRRHLREHESCVGFRRFPHVVDAGQFASPFGYDECNWYGSRGRRRIGRRGGHAPCMETKTSTRGIDSVSERRWERHLGHWFDELMQSDVEASLLWLGDGQRSGDFFTRSDGTPILARPFYNTQTGLPDSQLIAFPGVAAGQIGIATSSDLLSTGLVLVRLAAARSVGPHPLVGWLPLSATAGGVVDSRNS